MKSKKEIPKCVKESEVESLEIATIFITVTVKTKAQDFLLFTFYFLLFTCNFFYFSVENTVIFCLYCIFYMTVEYAVIHTYILERKKFYFKAGN